MMKTTSYGRAARLPLSPAKAFSNKLKLGSYRSDGRGARATQSKVATGNTNENFVKLADTGEGDGE